jgi:hypothetical protein
VSLYMDRHDLPEAKAEIAQAHITDLEIGGSFL